LDCWGGSPKGSQGAVAPVFSPFPQGKGGQGDWGYNAYGNPINNNLSIPPLEYYHIKKLRCGASELL